MTRVLNEIQAKADLSELITAACNGEDVIITRNSVPTVQLTLIAKPETLENQQQALIKKREKAIAAIKEHRKGAIIGPPMTIEEIISARDDGRKYL